MRILIVHTSYQFRGGEDTVYEAERDLLKRHGHDVLEYHASNSAVHDLGKLTAAQRTFWSYPAYHEIRALVREHQPDIVHFHNTFPLISPAAYYAARREGAAVVQTLHNYRLTCPSGVLFRDGKICEECVGKPLALPGIRHKCYRGSRAATLAVAGMLAFHRMRGTWRNAVDAYISLTTFSRNKFIEAGIPAERLAVKPNFLVDDPGVGTRDSGAAIFVGRLSEEKGVRTMLDAMPHMADDFELWVLGEGPLDEVVREAARRDPRIKQLGSLPHDQVIEHLGRASVLLLPSTNFEGFPLTIVEAFSRGVPVIASNHGMMSAFIAEGRNGAHFAPGNATALAAATRRVLEDPDLLARLSSGARTDFDRTCEAGENHRLLMRIYAAAIDANKRRSLPVLDDELIGIAPAASPRPAHQPEPTEAR